MRRMAWRLAACVTVLAMLFCVPVRAAMELPLLVESMTALASTDGAYAYTPEGALQLSAPQASGASATVTINQRFNVNTVKYLQMAVQSTAPFNIALKMTGESYDMYPQITGPSWYEAFQATAPGDGEGVAPGSYTISLDMQHYIKYNGLEVSSEGYVTLKTVHIVLRGAGDLLVTHLKVSDSAEFVTAGGATGVAATTVTPITTVTVSKATLLPTQAPIDSEELAGQVSNSYANSRFPTEMVVVLVLAGVLVVLAIVWTIVWPIIKDKREEREESRTVPSDLEGLKGVTLPTQEKGEDVPQTIDTAECERIPPEGAEDDSKGEECPGNVPEEEPEDIQ